METSRLLLVIVGDIDANELQKKVAATSGKLPRGDYKEAAYPAIDFSKPTVDITERCYADQLRAKAFLTRLL